LECIVTTLILSASTLLGLRRVAMKTLVAHLPDTKANGMTKTDLAQTLGITRARLHALEHRRVEQFSLDALIGLALRLGLTVRMSMTRPYERSD
jgi:predicted XRE-type DNA-binding protein